MKKQPASVQLLTDAPKGYTLNRRQVFSPDREWCVFDTRNHDPDIGITRSIERLHLESGRVETLYTTQDIVPSPSEFGPGVGAAAYHPHVDRVIFIHGLFCCSAEAPYGIARRFGLVLDVQSKGWLPMESRVIQGLVPLGRLSGGTHAHSWNPAGNRVSFTYDDALDNCAARTVGWAEFPAETQRVLVGEGVESGVASGGSFDGAANCFLVARCSEGERLLQAVEECWVGNDRLAFLGKVPAIDQAGTRFEIFVAKLPESNSVDASKKLGVGAPTLEAFCDLQQITDFGSCAYAGVQGPRHWLVSDVAGEWIYFVRKDDCGIAQLHRVNIRSKNTEQLTELSDSIEGQISISPSGGRVAFVSGGRIYVWELMTSDLLEFDEQKYLGRDGKPVLRERFHGSYVGAPHFIDDSNCLINRYLMVDGKPYLQILRVEASLPIANRRLTSSK